ncbi:MAG TPA: STAS domain-containing protein [Streptomyces sp.]|uniref:STAS domain-containing protein n=1 Tax=Streptomyces sp. TaxID=1931 RepID=UPI002D3FF7BE|nr:STAS domain-containing protein [Streptomyces sp.]HZG05526.1 STAS domain-containing protein [Streptomyces sp.]
MAVVDGLHTAVFSSGDRAIVSVSGEVDLTTVPRLRCALETALASGPGAIDVDFGAVPFCDCSGVNALVGAWRQARDTGVPLRVTGAEAPAVARLFQVLGVESLLGPEPSS